MNQHNRKYSPWYSLPSRADFHCYQHYDLSLSGILDTHVTKNITSVITVTGLTVVQAWDKYNAFLTPQAPDDMQYTGLGVGLLSQFPPLQYFFFSFYELQNTC